MVSLSSRLIGKTNPKDICVGPPPTRLQDSIHLAQRTMRILTLLFVCLLISAAPAMGQAPKIAGSGPAFSASLGYSYFNLGLQPTRASLNGLDSTFTVDFRPRFGVTLDLGYVRGSDVNGSTRHADVLSYLAGPVFYLTRNKGLTTYAHALGGDAIGQRPGARRCIWSRTAWGLVGRPRKLRRRVGVSRSEPQRRR